MCTLLTNGNLVEQQNESGFFCVPSFHCTGSLLKDNCYFKHCSDWFWDSGFGKTQNSLNWWLKNSLKMHLLVHFLGNDSHEWKWDSE